MDKITKSLLDTFSSQYEIESLSESTRLEHFSNFSITSKLFRASLQSGQCATPVIQKVTLC